MVALFSPPTILVPSPATLQILFPDPPPITILAVETPSMVLFIPQRMVLLTLETILFFPPPIVVSVQAVFPIPPQIKLFKAPVFDPTATLPVTRSTPSPVILGSAPRIDPVRVFSPVTTKVRVWRYSILLSIHQTWLYPKMV